MRRIAVVVLALLIIPPAAVAAPRCCPNGVSFMTLTFQSGRDQFSGKLVPLGGRGHCDQRRRIVIKRLITRNVVAKTRTRHNGRYPVHTDATNGPWFAHAKPVTRGHAYCYGATSAPVHFEPPPG